MSHVSSWHLVFGLQTSRSGSVEGTRLRVWGFGPGVPILFWVRSRVQVSESKVWVQDPEFGSGVDPLVWVNRRSLCPIQCQYESPSEWSRGRLVKKVGKFLGSGMGKVSLIE